MLAMSTGKERSRINELAGGDYSTCSYGNICCNLLFSYTLNPAPGGKSGHIIPMTKDEIKQLKKGQEILVKARFHEMNDGDAEYFTEMVDTGVSNIHWSKPENIMLPPEKPKYDPCRLLKFGDKVRIVSRNNRHFNLDAGRFHNKIATIVCNEKDLDPDDLLSLEVEGEIIYSDAAYLELITPVEELEPYSVEKLSETQDDETWAIKRNGKILNVYHGGCHLPRCKAGARQDAMEACDRMNEEYQNEKRN